MKIFQILISIYLRHITYYFRSFNIFVIAGILGSKCQKRENRSLLIKVSAPKATLAYWFVKVTKKTLPAWSFIHPRNNSYHCVEKYRVE